METKARTKTSSLKEEGSPPLRGIFCVKTRQDMKRIEETEDCFILDFNPFDSFDVKRLSYSLDKDLEIIHETGQKKMEKKEEDDTPLRGIFCLKTRQDMKRFEETEDCFILDFDPFDSFDVKKLTFTDDDHHEGDKDLAIIHETGQCYCYVCDKPAPCAEWIISTSHCNAYDSTSWNLCRTK
ncbi:hypothetical protein ARALYDRAFT_495496 [Arabidopsis lyrata subsp. lyrata]|uniref:Uncharacterized protein n=1 Tax=Arabidopsis lyrata subsp. lyrata TaxID=81972 RepID=D7MTP9_ARALL|nr:hypothetical protein ARALYDRAFT_495496 [Arabidopsis lyrata subsp. lyrata]